MLRINKAKRLLAAVLSALMVVFCLITPVMAQTLGSITLTVGTVPAAAADSIVTIPVTADEVGNIVGFGLKFDYDRTKLEFNGWDNTGTVFGNNFNLVTTRSSVADVNTNMLKPALAYTDSNGDPMSTTFSVSGQGVIANIKFKVLAAGSNQAVSVSLSSVAGEVSVDDSTGPMTVIKVAGGVTTSDSPPAPTTDSITLTVGKVPAAAADSIVTIPVTADEVGNIVGFGLKFDYDRTKLEFNGWDNTGTVFGNNFNLVTTRSSVADVNTNMLKPALAYTDSNGDPMSTTFSVSGQGVIANIKYKVLAAGADQAVPVSLSSVGGEVSVDDSTGPMTVNKVAGGLADGENSATVVSVTKISAIKVPNNTILANVGLPSTVEVNLSDNTKQNVSVTWDGGTPAYSAAAFGTYVFTGTLTNLPSGVTNPNNVTATVNVIVGGSSNGLGLSIGSASGPAGSTVTVDISLQNVPRSINGTDGLYNTNFTLLYDQNALQVQSVTAGDLFSVASDLSSNVSTPGKIILLGQDDSVGQRLIKTDGTYATVCFTIKTGAAPGDYSLTIDVNPNANALTIDSSILTKLTVSPSGGKITVGGVVGDVNGDNVFDLSDYGYMKLYLLGKITSFPSNYGLQSGKVCSDGTATPDLEDYGYMKLRLLGKISKFPIEP